MVSTSNHGALADDIADEMADEMGGHCENCQDRYVLMNENLTIALDPSSGISLQAQIRQSIVELILNHSILPGDKLPSSRMLSQQLKVSRNTVIFAYQALVDTGYLQPRERSGYVVSDDAPTTRLVDTPGAQHLDHQLGDRPNPAANDDAASGKICLL